MRIAYFDCFAGASGDMIVASLLDAGLKLPALRRELGKLDLHGFTVKTARVTRGMLSALRFDVRVAHEHHAHRTLRVIERIIARSALSDRVKEDSRKVFLRLAQAEAKVHRTRPEEIEFHEVGAVDSIVDIVGAAIALEALGVEAIYFSPLHLGTGTVRCRHGVLPVPAPATVELVKGIQVMQGSVEAELTTPTGAAVLTAMGRCQPPPPARFDAVGHGAGTRELVEIPNVLRVRIGEVCPPRDGDRVCVMETNIDDMPSQIYGHLFDRLFAAGALDVFATPIHMKKNRPAVLLNVIAPTELVPLLEEILFSETTTFGIRRHEVERTKLSRKETTVATRHGKVRVKIGRMGKEIKTVAPEYEDCRKAAEKAGVPLKAVWQAALNATKTPGKG